MEIKRALVLGCCGAGKSTFATALSSISELELIHLDQYYWKPNWEEPNPVDWENIVQKLAGKPQWIIDGNYGGTIDIRIRQADTIIYLDYPTWLCLWRVTVRTLKYWGKERPDMPEGCKERFDWEYFHFVATFNLRNRKRLLKKLDSFKQEKRIFIFKHDRQAYDFLENLKNNKQEFTV